MVDLQSSFPYIICIFFLEYLLFLFWDNFENRCFLALGFMVLLCSFTKKKTASQWQGLAVFIPPSVSPLSNVLCAAMYPERGILLNVSRSGYI